MRIPARGRCPRLEAQAFPRKHGSSGKSAHANIDIDVCYDVIKDVHVCGEFRRPHVNINTVFMVQDME